MFVSLSRVGGVLRAGQLACLRGELANLYTHYILYCVRAQVQLAIFCKLLRSYELYVQVGLYRLLDYLSGRLQVSN